MYTHTYIYIHNICVLNIHHICTSTILLLFICIRLYWPMCMLQNNHQGIVIPLEEFIFWIAFVGEGSFSWFAHVKCSVWKNIVLEWLSRKILLLPLLLLHSLEPHLRFSRAILSSSRLYRVSPAYRPIVRILLLHSCCGIVPEVVLLVEQRIWLIKLNVTFEPMPAHILHTRTGPRRFWSQQHAVLEISPCVFEICTINILSITLNCSVRLAESVAWATACHESVHVRDKHCSTLQTDRNVYPGWSRMVVRWFFKPHTSKFPRYVLSFFWDWLYTSLGNACWIHPLPGAQSWCKLRRLEKRHHADVIQWDLTGLDGDLVDYWNRI